MIRNGINLLASAPIVDMMDHKAKEHGVSYGLSEAGYDIRLKQDIMFCPANTAYHYVPMGDPDEDGQVGFSRIKPDYDFIRVYPGKQTTKGRFTIASAMEEFQMPADLVGIVHDKSTWARRGLSVFNTVIEPGWKGFLTLELVYHGSDVLHLPAGCGIAQVIFSRIETDAQYKGKYQNQENRPIPAIMEKG